MRILVCGGRDFNDYPKMYKILSEYFPDKGNSLIHGCADGADYCSEQVIYDMCEFNLNSLPEIFRFPADWKKYGKAAGYIRNKQMLEEGKPDLVIAFPGGKGTANMIKLAKETNVPVKEIA